MEQRHAPRRERAMRIDNTVECISIEAEMPWHSIPMIPLAQNAQGLPVSGNNTTAQIAWNDTFLFVRFLCRYTTLDTRQGEALLDQPTAELWNHDVVEVFIAAGDAPPTRYAEFELSPRGEWLSLQIETLTPGQPTGTTLVSSTRFAASINNQERTWRGVMQIPFAALMPIPPVSGMPFRINLFRCQGNPAVELAWQPTLHASFHVPERFGHLLLE